MFSIIYRNDFFGAICKHPQRSQHNHITARHITWIKCWLSEMVKVRSDVSYKKMSKYKWLETNGSLQVRKWQQGQLTGMYNLKCNILLLINLYINKISYVLVLWSSLYLHI